MDNGVKQQQMTEQFKSEIKRHASQRRTESKIRTLAQQLDGADLILTSASSGFDLASTTASNRTDLSSTTVSNGADLASITTSNGADLASTTASDGAVSPANEQRNSALCLHGSHSSTSFSLNANAVYPQPAHKDTTPWQRFTPDQAVQSRRHLEDIMLMAYLDYLFPVIHPFYRTSLAKGGRVWTLAAIHNNSCLRHGIIALASHLLAKPHRARGPSIQICEVLDERHMRQQTHTALQNALNDLEAVRSRGIQGNVLESSRIFCSIVQLLLVESHIGTGSWRLHLEGAVSLLQQVIGGVCEDNDPGSAFETVIHQLGILFVLQRPNPPLFTPDQSAFRFYTTTLIFSDVIASTSRDQQPQLHHYYSASLLANGGDSIPSVKLDIAEVFGVHNETLLIISAVASLAAWKKVKADSQQLSLSELVRQSEALEARLEHHLADLKTPTQEECDQPSLTLDFLAEKTPLPWNTSQTIRRIWALATKSYLFITVSGIQLSHPSLREDVSETIELLQWLASHDGKPVAAWLRALAWPICVTGLLVQSPDEQRVLKKLLFSLDPLVSFGAVRNLTEIIEGAWELRERHSNARDNAYQISSLGSLMGGALLI